MAEDTPETQTDPTPASVAAPVAAGQALHISDETPSPAAAPGKPLEKGGTGKAVVRTRYPVDHFDHNVKGVERITAAGIEVDRKSVDAVLKAAEDAGVELEEVDHA